ncbi:MAG: response regulator [Cyanobacteria bacterium P01_A01_bin.114]
MNFSSHYIPHGHCYLWQTPLVGLHAVSDLLIAIAYFSIPITLLFFFYKRKSTFSVSILVLFSLFIVLCGLGHLLDIVTLWYPIYWVSGTVRAATALVSCYTAVECLVLLPKFLALKGPAELKVINQRLKKQIAEQASIEQTLEKNQEIFKEVFQDVPLGIALVSIEGRFLKVNKALTEMIGYTPQELLDTDFQAITHPDDLQADLDYLDELIGGKRRFYQMEKRYFHKLGHDVTVQLNVTLLSDPDGKPLSFIAHIQDISEQKQMNADLISATQAAEAANQAKSDFLSMMSHEIRTPMNAMLGMTELLSETALEAQQQDYVEVICTSGNTLLKIINDILDFSKIESKKLELEMGRFDLYECVEEVMTLFSNQAEQKGLSLTTLIEPANIPRFFKGDAVRLRQILTNLLSNSIKFTDKGEVSIQAKVQPINPETTDVETTRPHYEIQFVVKDTGIGIAQGKIKSLFQPFQQVDASTTRKYGGTGLGLVISRQLIEMMGGKIEIESEPGQGTTFHFSIKLEAYGRALQTGRIQHELDLRQKRLLIVDSNQTSRRYLTLQAESWHLEVYVADSAEATFVTLFRSQPFDVIVINEPLPDMNHRQLASHIRNFPNYQTVPLILLQNRQQSSVQQRSLPSNKIKLLQKPIKRSQFYNALVQLLVDEDAFAQADISPAQTSAPAMTSKTPLRILLTEDIPLNQKVALEMLAMYGHQADVVNNGKEALEALRHQPYDLVLMDIQMPKMDGLEATREIRSDLDIVQPHIIAMTAHAMQGDREACFTAGMNGYISKPIRKHDLGRALQQCLAPKKPLRSRRQIAPTTASMTVPIQAPEVAQEIVPSIAIPDLLPNLADLSTLDLQSLEALSNDRSFLFEVCNTFLAEAPQRIVAIQTALDQQHATALAQAAHALKSLSSCVGAARLYQICQLMEAMGKAANCTQTAQRLIEPIQSEYKQVRTALQHYRDTLQS